MESTSPWHVPRKSPWHMARPLADLYRKPGAAPPVAREKYQSDEVLAGPCSGVLPYEVRVCLRGRGGPGARRPGHPDLAHLAAGRHRNVGAGHGARERGLAALHLLAPPIDEDADAKQHEHRCHRAHSTARRAVIIAAHGVAVLRNRGRWRRQWAVRSSQWRRRGRERGRRRRRRGRWRGRGRRRRGWRCRWRGQRWRRGGRHSGRRGGRKDRLRDYDDERGRVKAGASSHLACDCRRSRHRGRLRRLGAPFAHEHGSRLDLLERL
eukprot:scaffold1261_cov49-Phaeocystis_antarctica.AAC.1